MLLIDLPSYLLLLQIYTYQISIIFTYAYISVRYDFVFYLMFFLEQEVPINVFNANRHTALFASTILFNNEKSLCFFIKQPGNKVITALWSTSQYKTVYFITGSRSQHLI